ncbi:hypothetical protein CSC94_19330 [Zhengella mangrovi]|uniref:Biotin transporter BioY n=1 Tax=Zhengella mangrovi TaxID=1982044 RepID=A0A2G1QJ06_9HYPH|nr:hypothetical protein [Zhengella mangrovi]PHP65503.1 hypothetical protein CSC94_19330 [Zhengella mangrovi]
MDPIEKAIRTALEKGDASDAKHRERVYLSALSALERSLKTQPGIPAEVAAKRREALRHRIREIETEFRPATAPEPEPVVERVEPVVAAGPAGTRSEPAVPDVAPERPADAGSTGRESDFVSQLRVTRGEPDAAGAVQVSADDAGERRIFSRRRRPYARFLTISLLVVFVGIGGWWLYSSEALVPLSVRDGAVPNPPTTLREDEFSPAQTGDAGRVGQPPQGGSWITVFSPEDPTTVTAPSGTAVEVTGDGKEMAVRISPSAPDSAAVFDMGEGILSQLAGKRVTFDINASSPEGQTTQMSIQCNFAELGGCGRKRFDVEATRQDFLFDVDLPDKNPGSFGSISLTPDISEGSIPVNIYEIRVFMPEG